MRAKPKAGKRKSSEKQNNSGALKVKSLITYLKKANTGDLKNGFVKELIKNSCLLF